MSTFTSIFKTRKESNSLRTTIPETYVKVLKLSESDYLEWDNEIVDGQFVVTVKKAKNYPKDLTTKKS